MQTTYLAFYRMGRRRKKGLSGEGDPNAVIGAPTQAGLIYTNTLNGQRFLSRNALNFNNDTSITIPSILCDRVTLKIWHNDPAPSAMRPFLSNAGYTSRSIRSQTTGFVNTTNSPTTQINGASVANNSTDFPANQWSTLNVSFSGNVFEVTSIGRRPSAQGLIGRLASIEMYSSGVLARNYSIDDNGVGIVDSVSGQNGSLTIGSGSWQLDWVPI
jgi:hypothetical protein